MDVGARHGLRMDGVGGTSATIMAMATEQPLQENAAAAGTSVMSHCQKRYAPIC